ncbi:copper resistance protein CopC [Pseudomonas sp. MM211]|uniref:copper resistance protein CopC n=1 Tax=Pseudomonas sp. MM211 TaxID=2866808 RepID=UPI001CED17A9|nr:copper resistance protein CopC [Pseudomonas sp. MM211]UCJ17080.1 copper resistance protein CopC [Pseudomonas sp. MM211]
MHGSEPEDGAHSTPDKSSRPRPWLRVICSLAIFGFLIGLMIGRLFHPDAMHLKAVDAAPDQLVLWFNVEPQVQVSDFQGAFVLRFEGLGREQQGQLQVAGRAANWRVMRDGRELEVRILAARPLRAELNAEEVDGRWRLTIRLALR